ncbi:MAG TPA: hypothetical protein VGJ74_03125 [Burkholderiales bacterium]|jgi:hypothetical protein
MDPNGKFRYWPSFETDIRKTFDRIRREQVDEKAREQDMAKAAENVKPLKRRTA